MKNVLGHQFIDESDVGSYFRCCICDIIIYNHRGGIISQRNIFKVEPGRILDISCEEVIIKNLLE